MLEYLEEQVGVQKVTFDSVTKIAESIAESKQITSTISTKPVCEYKAMQQFKTSAGDRVQFRERNEKLTGGEITSMRPTR